MNMFYTGLGISRSLGEHGVSVVGLTAQRGIYGNYTRYAHVRRCPDSREASEELLEALIRIGEEIGSRSIIFPTRDDDCLFLDRFRVELDPYFIPVLPPSAALRRCLDKWETYLLAKDAGVPTPGCYLVEDEDQLADVSAKVGFPCVLKPVSSHDWRKGANWKVVGARKAIGISSQRELLREYTKVARAGKRVLIQEMIPGDDNCLTIVACYLDRASNWVAAFGTRKLAQSPAGFGTGCVVQAIECPDLHERTVRLLRTIGYSGIAEVEYKWDSRNEQFQLIEINPRPWDQHRLGASSGVDLIYLAYCEHAGLPKPAFVPRIFGHKWIAEDAFFMMILRLLWKRDRSLWSVLRTVQGKRVYAIWSWKDPLPLLLYLLRRFVPGLLSEVRRFLWSALKVRMLAKGAEREKGTVYESHL